jgi:hypothetical protein
MPVVPLSKENTVRSTPLPGARVDTTQPLSAFGGGEGLDQTVNAARGLSEDIGKIAVEQQKDANDVRNMQTALDMSKVQDGLTVKLKDMRGKDALAAPDVISQDWKKQTDDIYSGLSNNSQKDYFNKERNAQAIELYRKVSSHVSTEQTNFAKSVYIATLDNNINKSADHQDADSLNQHIDGIKGIVKGYGNKFGEDQTVIDKMSEDAAQKAVDTAVMTRLQQTGDEKQAQELLDSVSHNITTDDYMKTSYKLEKRAETLRNITTRNINIAQNKNALDVLDNMQKNTLSFTGWDDVEKLDVPEPFKIAVKDALLKNIQDITNDRPKHKVSIDDVEVTNQDNELFAKHLADVLNSGDQENIIRTMSETLRNYGKGTISQENMNTLVRMAVVAGRNRPIKMDANNGVQVASKQVPIDAGAKAILGMNIKDPQVFSDYMDNLKTMDPQTAQDTAVRAYVIKKNPGIKSIPAEGQMRVDRNGNKAIVFPDGSYKLLDGAKKAPEKK